MIFYNHPAEPSPPNGTTIDHYFPLGKSGTNDLDNLALCCYDCNMAKDNHYWPYHWYVGQLLKERRNAEGFEAQNQDLSDVSDA
jgi:hypothetical protein